MAKDYYNILGVEKSASKADISKAFRKLAHKYHPDKKGGDESRFKEVSEAYSVLSDVKKKSEYDAYGRVFEGGGGGGQGSGGFSADGFDFSNFASGAAGAEFDLGDIFGDIFGGGRRQGAARGRDISIDLEIPFRDAIFGTERNVLLTKTGTCTTCSGSGAKEKTELTTCTTCNGNGKIHETKRSILGAFSSVRVCDMCSGTGKVPKDTCSTCKGRGVLRAEEEVRVEVPVGLSNGEMIRLSGRGEALKGGTPGDLYVKIHVQPDPVFRKEGTNIVMTLDVKLSDALLGATYSVKTLDGDIEVKIPTGISHNEVLRVREKGVPIDSRRRGDLLIRIHITIPQKLSKLAKEAIQTLRKEGV